MNRRDVLAKLRSDDLVEMDRPSAELGSARA